MIKIIINISLLILFICFNTNILVGQEQQLVQQLKKADEIEKIKIYDKLILANTKKNPKQALVWANEKLRLCIKNNQKNEELDTYLSLGVIYVDKGWYDSSLVYYKNALKIAKVQKNQQKIGDLYGNISVCFIEKGELEKGIFYVLKSIKIQEQHKNYPKLARMYINLGDIYSKLNKMKEAQTYLRKAIAIANRLNDKSLLGAAQNTYGISFTQTGQLDSALVYFQKSAILREEIKEYTELYWNYNNIGGIYYYYQDFKTALSYFEKCLETAKKLHSPAVECSVLNNIGSIYKEMKQYDQAISYHQQALDIARKIKQANVKLDALENLKGVYETKGAYKEALSYQVQFNALKDSVFSLEKSKQIDEIQTKYQVAKKNFKIKNQGQLLEKAKTIRIGLSIILFLLVLVAIGLILWLRTKQKQRLQQVIFEEKQKGLQQIIETEEKERARIAKDLHDGIVQDLTVLKLKLNQIGGDQDLIKDFDSSIKQVREISYQMMPVTLRELGLVPAIDDMLEKTLKPNGISVDFEALNFDFRLPENIEVSLFRISQELVNNVIKHSKAKHVSVILRYQNDQITLVFEDDGQGFNLEATKKGIGLNSLSSRVELVNGNINYESSEHSGTIAIVRIPFKK